MKQLLGNNASNEIDASIHPCAKTIKDAANIYASYLYHLQI
jgi:hypothetical protein